MLKPTVKNYNVKEQICGFDFNNANTQVCQLQGKALEQEQRVMAQMFKEKDLITLNGANVDEIIEQVNSATPIISERDYEVKKGDETIPMHSHTTIYRSAMVVAKVSDELTLRVSKRYTRLEKTNKQTGEVTITGETHYKLYVNDVLHKIDAPTVPDSTIPDNEKGYTVNFHGEQEFRRMLEKQLRF